MEGIVARRKPLIRAAGILIALAVLSVCLWRIVGQLDLERLKSQAWQIRTAPVGLALLVYGTALWLSAYEWTLLLPSGVRLPVTRLYGIQAVMSLLQTAVHHFAGQGYAIYQLVRREKLDSPAAVSLIAVDQLAEGFAKLALIVPAVLFFALPGSVGHGAQSLGLGLLVLLAALAVLLLAGRRLTADTGRAPDKWSAARRLLLAGSQNLRRLIQPRILLLATSLAFSKKLVRALSLLCVQQSLSIPLAWYVPFLVVAAIDLVTMVPLVPGHLGIFEAAVVLVYRSQGLDGDQALLAALLYHGVVLAASALPGLCVLGLEHARPTEGAAEEAAVPAIVPSSAET
jgi:glycosyltransferase 2 family protein